jgi:transposase
MGKYKTYDKDFKVSAVKLVVESNHKIAAVAKDLDIPEQTLGKWVRSYRENGDAGFIGSGNLSPEDQALKELKKQIRDLEEENAILKKAMSIFVKERK